MADIIFPAGSFNKFKGMKGFTVAYDLNIDGAINMGDVIMLATKFGMLV